MGKNNFINNSSFSFPPEFAKYRGIPLFTNSKIASCEWSIKENTSLVRDINKKIRDNYAVLTGKGFDNVENPEKSYDNDNNVSVLDLSLIHI